MSWTDILRCARRTGLIAALAIVAIPASAQSPEEAARAVVERLQSGLVESAALPAFDDRYAALLPIVRSTHDLTFIAELTIRRQWRELTAPERQAFLDAFEHLSVATYAARFAQVGPDTFNIGGERMLDDGRIEVNAEIVRHDQPNVSLDYLLQNGGAGWRIVSILADGVSDLALKRAQYQKVFRDGGSIGDLISEIETEADALH